MRNSHLWWLCQLESSPWLCLPKFQLFGCEQQLGMFQLFSLARFPVMYLNCFPFLSNVSNVLSMYFYMTSRQWWNHLLCVLHRVIILSDNCQLPFYLCPFLHINIAYSYVSRSLWLIWFPAGWCLLLMNHNECQLLFVPVHCSLIIIFSHWHSNLSLNCSFFL
jgi:hypothetical protein